MLIITFFSPLLLLEYCNINVSTQTHAHMAYGEIIQLAVIVAVAPLKLVEVVVNNCSTTVVVVAAVTVTALKRLLNKLPKKILGIARFNPDWLALLSRQDVLM